MAGNLIKNISDYQSEIYFSREHTWAQKNIYGLIKIGISDYWINNFENVFISRACVTDKQCKAGESILELRCDKEKVNISSPISGVIKFINPNIKEKRILDPLGEDWIALLLADNFILEREKLLTEAAYKKYLPQSFNEMHSV